MSAALVILNVLAVWFIFATIGGTLVGKFLKRADRLVDVA